MVAMSASSGVTAGLFDALAGHRLAVASSASHRFLS
jgi:hypothetical protein